MTFSFDETSEDQVDAGQEEPREDAGEDQREIVDRFGLEQPETEEQVDQRGQGTDAGCDSEKARHGCAPKG